LNTFVQNKMFNNYTLFVLMMRIEGVCRTKNLTTVECIVR